VETTCSKSCPCKEPKNWRSEIVAMTDLVEVEIVGFKAEDREIDFLEQLLRCASVLKKVSIKLPELVSLSQSKSEWKKVARIVTEYPNVDCLFYCNDCK